MGHQGFRGYGTYCHIRNAKNVFKNIDIWRKRISEKEVKVKLHDKEDVSTLSKLKETLCRDYFKRYFEKQSKEGPVVLPQISSGIHKKVVETMERWCNDTNDSFDMKGLVVHSFNVLECFGKLFYDEFEKEKLLKDLHIKDFPSSPIVMVYNPSKSVILLIRTSTNKGLREQIEFCSHDMKMFMLLFGDEVKSNRLKVISLLASNETTNEHLKCEDCKNCIVSYETVESYDLFRNWFHDHAVNFKIDADNTDEIIHIAALAKLVGCLAAAPYFDDLPTFTKVTNEQMKHMLLILTPEQKRILYSGDKHVLIQGPYGSGKTIIAHKKLQMLSDEFEESDNNGVVHFICHDSKSALLSEIEKRPNVIAHDNKRGEKLSVIVNNILKVGDSNNVNIIIEEYDGENLDKKEAETLNAIFEEKFRDAVVFLVPQAMEKERNLNMKEKSEKEEKNKFSLLKKLKRVDLNLVMRNSVEISNLIRETEVFLEKQETIYQHPYEEDASKGSTKPNESVKELAESGNNLKIMEPFKIKPIISDEKKAITETRLSEAVADIEKPIDEPIYKATEEYREEISLGDMSSDVENKKKCAVEHFGLDEAFGFAEIAIASKNEKNRIVNRFRYKASKGMGHNINSIYPKLFEVDYENTENNAVEKCLALIHVFKKLHIKNSDSNNKHVILHFDTSTNEIPRPLVCAIEYFEVSHKVTNNYENFKYSKDKSILVCSFRLFRGLENPIVTIFIDQDIYSLQHYLVETMARCTNKLNIVVLEKSDAFSKIKARWECGLKGKKLIDQCNVQIISEKEKEVDHHEDERLNLITICGYSKDREKMRKIFDQHEPRNRDRNMKLIAEEYIQKR